MSDNTLNRRDMIGGLLALSSAGALASCGPSGGNSVLRPDNVSYPIGSEKNRNTYGNTHGLALRRIVDAIIPDTDSPGGIAAGVPERIEMVLLQWLPSDERSSWVRRLNEVEDALTARMASPFAGAQSADQVAAIKAIDSDAYGDGGPGSGPYRQLKNEIVTAYYTTEVGCTEELQYLAVPGEWRSCVPLSEIGRTWAA